jgi:DNA-binding CsgD family transcriptional regulator
LQAIADVFNDVGTVMVYQRDDGGFGAFASAGLEKMIEDYSRNFNGQDLRSLRGIERGIFLGRDAVTDGDMVTQEEMDHHPFYKMLARHGLKYCVAVPILLDARINIAISVQRSSAKPAYTQSDLDGMSRIGRHAEKALRLSTRLLESELGNLGLRDALSRVGIGVFALDALGRVVFSNPVGQSLLGDGLSIVDERLRVRGSNTDVEIEAAIATVVRGARPDMAADPKPLMVHRARSHRPLILYVLPVIGPLAPDDRLLSQARAIVLVMDPKSDDPPDPALVRDVLGITLGEARVAALIGSGLAPRAAAEKLGITEETARTVLKRVFSKVGVSRQSELVALLTKSVLR